MPAPRVLLTGVTGFLGGAAATALLHKHEDAGLVLLVRATSQEEAEARVRRSLARFAEPGRADFPLERCALLRGDLTEPTTYTDSSFDGITHVLHLAANTSFCSVRGVRHTNILGTLMLAHRMRRVPGLARFLHVGTAFICGADPPRVVCEDDYPRPGVRHLAEYTASKAEAELLLEGTAPELPLVVARPSIVVGHTRLGCAPSASIFWYYRAVDLLRRVPVPLDRRKDIVPVDYVADALLRLLFRPVLRHHRYHISAGEAAAVSWGEMAEVFARYHGRRRDTPYRVVDSAALWRERCRVRELLGAGDEERLLNAMEAFFRFSACGVEVFDNQRLLDEGLPPPPRFTEYLPACIERPGRRSVYEQMWDDA
jgi:nucleoside-diphosphate-sugar epimerase